MPAKYTPEQRIAAFWNKVDKSGDPNGCWLWAGAKNEHSYGIMSVAGRSSLVHRWSYQQFVGAIPDGLQVLHNCPDGDNPSCVNPAHLFLGTHTDNMRDMVTKQRHWTTTHPESRATGTRNGSVVHPECLLRGEKRRDAKLTDNGVRDMRRRHGEGEGIPALALEFGVSYSVAKKAIHRETWKHID